MTGSLTVVSGFSGAGKGTIMKELVARYPQYSLSVSVTTRAPRQNEVDGRDYHFISQDAFDRMVENNELLEHAGYVGNNYGTPAEFVYTNMASGRDVLLEIDVQGGQIIRNKIPGTIMLYIAAPSPQILQQRLLNRKSDDLETIHRRLVRAKSEVQFIPQYDALIINDDLDEAVEAVHQTIQAFKRNPARYQAFIDSFAAGLADLH